MNNNKYYRVREKKDNTGRVVFKVQACSNIFELIIGFWLEYDYENKTLEESIKHIDIINKKRIASERTVYKKRFKD